MHSINTKNKEHNPLYIRAKDVAKRYSIGLSTVWSYVNKGKFVTYKVENSRVTLFNTKEVEKALGIEVGE